MLGQAYQEVVMENGNKPPHFGMSTMLDLASKLWLKTRALERGKGLNPAFYVQVVGLSKITSATMYHMH